MRKGRRTYALAAAVEPKVAEAAHFGIPPHSYLQNIPVGGFPQSAAYKEIRREAGIDFKQHTADPQD